MEPPQLIEEGESSEAAHFQKQPRNKITVSQAKFPTSPPMKMFSLSSAIWR
jgi:hypothetical protein